MRKLFPILIFAMAALVVGNPGQPLTTVAVYRSIEEAGLLRGLDSGRLYFAR